MRGDLRRRGGDGRPEHPSARVTAQGRSRAFVNGELVTAGAAEGAVGPPRRTSRPARASDAARPDHAPGDARRLRRAGDARVPRWRRRSHDAGRRRRGCARVQPGRHRPRERHELLRSRWRELERKAALRPGEDEELATTRQVLASAERVERLCLESYDVAVRQRRGRAARARRRVEARRRARGARAAVPAVPRAPATASSRSSRTSRSSCGGSPRRHRRVAGASCRRSRNGSRCSSV